VQNLTLNFKPAEGDGKPLYWRQGDAHLSIRDIKISGAPITRICLNSPTYWTNWDFSNANIKWNIYDYDKRKLIPQYYLDVLVQDENGNPIPDATVTVTNEVDDVNYPSENLHEDWRWVPACEIWSGPCSGNGLNAVQYWYDANDFRSTKTGSDGHTPLPIGNESTTLVVADYWKKNATVEQKFTYTIIANKTTNQGNVILKNTTNTIYPNGTVYYSENKTFSGIVTGVNPNGAWYRPNPMIPTYTVNITITNDNEVNMSVNSSTIINLTMNEYSPKLINFTATNTTPDQKMNITVYNGTFKVVNGKKYEIKKDGTVQQTKTAGDNKVVFTDIPVGSDYVITESISFSINLNSPPNQTTINDPTPDFNFTVSGSSTTYNCTLFINNTNYGTNSSTLNNTPTIITANSSLSDGTYNWYINCSAGENTTKSEVREITITTPTTTTTTSTSTIPGTTTTTSTSTTTTTTTSTSTTTTLGITTTTTVTTTTTIIWPCDLPGDYPPCGEVTLEEVVDFINLWSLGQADLGDVVNLINAWAEGPVCELPGDYPPCGEVTLKEVVDFINLWAQGQADLGDVVNLINAWAGS